MKEEKNFEIQDLESRLARIVEWIKTCDTKTSFLLALVGVMLPIVLQSKLLQDDMMLAFTKIGDKNVSCVSSCLCYIYVIAVLGFGLLLLTSCWKFLNVLFAKRTESLNERILGNNCESVDQNVFKNSLLHFHHISTMTYEQFKSDFDAETSDGLREDLLSQIYINSCRCNEKYTYYNDGVRYLFFSGCLLVITFLLHMILFGA